MAAPLSFDCKVIAAPMVRVSHLGFRMHCASYGADAVFTEEIIAHKLAKCIRVVNEAKGIVEYVSLEPHGKPSKRILKRTVVFSTLVKGEGAPLILQLGAPAPEVALKAAQLVEKDVAGIDLNMGCPKKFSAQCGMGAALMAKPDVACAILTTLVQGVKVPVSVKTRLMDTDEAAVTLIRRLASTGVHAITIHARTRDQRPAVPALYDRFEKVIAMLREGPNPVTVPILLNGDVGDRVGAMELMRRTKCSGVMIARAAMYNPSIFRTDDLPMREALEAVKDNVRWHIRYDSCFTNVKYHAQRTLQEYGLEAIYKDVTATLTMEELCTALGIDDEERDALIGAWNDPTTYVEAPPDYDYPIQHNHDCIERD
jgi:tRNA-dihydrouridine synthase 2